MPGSKGMSVGTSLVFFRLYVEYRTIDGLFSPARAYFGWRL
jgi:hypothetical protein